MRGGRQAGPVPLDRVQPASGLEAHGHRERVLQPGAASQGYRLVGLGEPRQRGRESSEIGPDRRQDHAK